MKYTYVSTDAINLYPESMMHAYTCCNCTQSLTATLCAYMGCKERLALSGFKGTVQEMLTAQLGSKATNWGPRPRYSPCAPSSATICLRPPVHSTQHADYAGTQREEQVCAHALQFALCSNNDVHAMLWDIDSASREQFMHVTATQQSQAHLVLIVRRQCC